MSAVCGALALPSKAVESNGAFPAAVARRTLHVDMGNIHFNFCELIFDVNSAYFYNHGGYEFAKQFYADAYEAAVKIIGSEQYILSAVMHADERNRVGLMNNIRACAEEIVKKEIIFA